MRATIDKAGRLVVPKALRDRLGLVPGEVEVTVDGTALRIEVVAGDELATETGGRLVIPPSASEPDGGPGTAALTDDAVQALRDADQR